MRKSVSLGVTYLTEAEKLLNQSLSRVKQAKAMDLANLDEQDSLFIQASIGIPLVKAQLSLNQFVSHYNHGFPANYQEVQSETTDQYVWLFIPEYPPKLKVFLGQLDAAQNLSYRQEQNRWLELMSFALKGKRPTITAEKAVVGTGYHLLPGMDPDQYLEKWTIDFFVYNRWIRNDDYDRIKKIVIGIPKKGKSGTEVLVSFSPCVDKFRAIATKYGWPF